MKKVIILVLVLVLMTPPMLLLFARAQCVNDGEVMNIDVQWRAVGGCYYETPDGFVPHDVFRYRVNSSN